jgi:hypothetical protein
MHPQYPTWWSGMLSRLGLFLIIIINLWLMWRTVGSPAVIYQPEEPSGRRIWMRSSRHWQLDISGVCLKGCVQGCELYLFRARHLQNLIVYPQLSANSHCHPPWFNSFSFLPLTVSHFDVLSFVLFLSLSGIPLRGKYS